MTCSSIDLLLHSSVDDRPESLLLVVGDDGVGEKGQGDGGAYRGSISANKSAPGSPPSAKSLVLPFALMLTTYEYLILIPIIKATRAMKRHPDRLDRMYMVVLLSLQ